MKHKLKITYSPETVEQLIAENKKLTKQKIKLMEAISTVLDTSNHMAGKDIETLTNALANLNK